MITLAPGSHRTEEAPTRCALRYHGGKYRLAPWIVSHFPPHRVYVEAFCGATSVCLHKPRASVEIINDRNDEIVNLFRVLRDPIQSVRLEALLRQTPYARTEYYAAFAPIADNPVEAARRLIVKSFMGFGAASLNTKHHSGFRVKWSGSYMSCSNSWTRYPDALATFCARLQGVAIENRPALTLIEQFDKPEVLLYLDPPYVPETRLMSHPSCRYAHDMTANDHRDMAVVLHKSTSMIALSGYPSALYAELFPTWKLVTCQARIEHGQERTEGLWLNPALVAALEQEHQRTQQQGVLGLL